MFVDTYNSVSFVLTPCECKFAYDEITGSMYRCVTVYEQEPDKDLKWAWENPITDVELSNTYKKIYHGMDKSDNPNFLRILYQMLFESKCNIIHKITDEKNIKYLVAYHDVSDKLTFEHLNNWQSDCVLYMFKSTSISLQEIYGIPTMIDDLSS